MYNYNEQSLSRRIDWVASGTWSTICRSLAPKTIRHRRHHRQLDQRDVIAQTLTTTT